MRDVKLFAGTVLAIVAYYFGVIALVVATPDCDDDDEDEEEQAEIRAPAR